MKRYCYKIQWLVDVTGAKKIISAIGVKSLDKIVIRDAELKRVEEYRDFIQYSTGSAKEVTFKWLDSMKKKYGNKFTVELLKK